MNDEYVKINFDIIKEEKISTYNKYNHVLEGYFQQNIDNSLNFLNNFRNLLNISCSEYEDKPKNVSILCSNTTFINQTSNINNFNYLVYNQSVYNKILELKIPTYRNLTIPICLIIFSCLLVISFFTRMFLPLHPNKYIEDFTLITGIIYGTYFFVMIFIIIFVGKFVSLGYLSLFLSLNFYLMSFFSVFRPNSNL
jgi:hypothetical protein